MVMPRSHILALACLVHKMSSERFAKSLTRSTA